MHANWEVQVFGGVGDVSPDAPVKFGVPTVYVGEGEDGGLSDATTPLVYGPVMLRSHARSLLVQSMDKRSVAAAAGGGVSFGYMTHREMEVVNSIEFTDWGHIDVSGFEVRDDGTPVVARWEVQPYQQPPDDEMLTEWERSLMAGALSSSDDRWWVADGSEVRAMNDGDQIAQAVRDDQATFIASCRWAIPTLLDEISSLRAQIASR